MTTTIPLAGETANVRVHARWLDAFWTVLVLVLPAVVTTTADTAFDNDLWWHLRTGDWIATQGVVPRVDAFSSTAFGRPWVDYSWLFDVLVAKLYHLGGLHSTLLMVVGLSLCVNGVLLKLLQRWTSPVRALLLLIFATLAVAPLRTPRPWLFTILFFSIELYCLIKACEESRPVWLVPLPPLFILWANVHIQFVYGLALIGVFTFDVSLPAKWRERMQLQARSVLSPFWLWALLPVCAVATLANPYGWRLYAVVGQYASQRAPLAIVQEMRAMDFRTISDWFVVMLLGAAVFALGNSRRRYFALIALLAASGFLALRSARDRWLVAIVSPVVIAVCRPGPIRTWERPGSGVTWGFPASLALTGLILSANTNLSSSAIGRRVSDSFPEQASAFIESHHLSGALFNSYDWGGFLLWRLPQMRVSIDGRANLYESYLPLAENNFHGAKTWDKDPAFRAAQTVLLEQGSSLASILRADRRYRLAYEDSVAALFVPAISPQPGH